MTRKSSKPKSIQDRRTPEWLVRCLERDVLGGKKFLLDAAAEPHNAVCKRYHTPQDNGLLQKWAARTFNNPGFKTIAQWIEKAIEQWERYAFTSCVVGPTGCSQRWLHEMAYQGTIYAPNDRISFCDPNTGAPSIPGEHGANRDTMIYVFGPNFENPRGRYGFHVLPLDVRGFLETWTGHLGAVGWSEGVP